VAHAQSHFALTNLVWHLPDLLVQRPGAEGRLEYIGDMSTHDYRWRVDARVDPNILASVVPDEAALRVLHQLTFSEAPVFRGEVWGRWHDLSSVRFDGEILARNFVFRGEPCTHFEGLAQLSDSTLRLASARIQQGTQEIRIPALAFDLVEQVLWVTNVISTMDPDLITRVIGPKVHAAFRPYRFAKPPTVRINGRLPTTDLEAADVRFEVAGESFSYWRLNLTNFTADVQWRGDSLTISQLESGFYGGQVTWQGNFDFSVPVGASLRFEGKATQADLHALMADLSRRTNRLEGSLDLNLVINSANSDDWRSWQGSGWAKLRDGFLWDIPIFGFFSPVLNKIKPGLGNSPISGASDDFTIDQSVVSTSDLELKSSALRLRYNGSVDYKGAVNARMQAEILHDARGVGRLLSWALWPLSKAFEYRITGTVYQPQSQPVYIPRMLLWPLHPFRSLKQLFAPEKTTPPAEVQEPLLPGPG
jgi:hypothetical protein